jgi:glycosyltransferase involved in cell wall biosynthesis
MTSVIKYYDGIESVAVIGNYLPRQCGIATFTTDLIEGLAAEAPDINCWVAAMNDKPDGYRYSEKVRFEINQNKLTDYSVASQFLNISQTDIVCVQHEYGLFGGPAGSHLLKLLGDLRMPVVTTLHTILKDPSPKYRDVMCRLSDLSDKLVVMSRKASHFLKEIYAVPEEKIAFIHHGIPDTPFIDSSFYKDKFGVEGKKVLLTFGLLPPIRALKMCCKRFRRSSKNILMWSILSWAPLILIFSNNMEMHTASCYNNSRVNELSTDMLFSKIGLLP